METTPNQAKPSRAASRSTDTGTDQTPSARGTVPGPWSPSPPPTEPRPRHVKETAWSRSTQPRWWSRPDTPFHCDEFGNLVFYEYDRTSEAYRPHKGGYWYALFFFIHFPGVWGGSFLFPGLVLWLLYARHYVWLLLAALFVAYIYAPIPKRRRNWQLFHFLTVAQYYKRSSYRVVNPQSWPELRPVLERLERESRGRPVDWDFSRLCTIVASIRPRRPRIWLCHPHGFTGIGWGQQAFNPYFPEVHHCIANVLYYCAPPVICYTSHLGNPTPVTKRAIEDLLARGESMTIILGGFEEATITPTRGDRLFMEKRNGIFRLAVKYGAELVPYFTFGESQMFTNVQGMWRFRLWLSKNSIPGIVPWGRFFYVPRNEMMHVVVGPTIAVRPSDTPESTKAAYLTNLRSLYARYSQYFDPDAPAELEIW